jgi:hypothetical protein
LIAVSKACDRATGRRTAHHFSRVPMPTPPRPSRSTKASLALLAAASLWLLPACGARTGFDEDVEAGQGNPKVEAGPLLPACAAAPAPTPTTLLEFTGDIDNDSFQFTGDATRLYTFVFGPYPSLDNTPLLSVDPCTGSATKLGASPYKGAIASQPGTVTYTGISGGAFAEDIVSSDPLGAHSSVVGLFPDNNDTVVSLVVHGGRAYGVTYENSSLVSWALDGRASTTLVPTDPNRVAVDWGAVAVDDDRVYFYGGGGLQTIPPGGGPTTTIWNDGMYHGCGGSEPPGYPLLLVDETYVYYTAADGLWRVAKDGSSVMQYPGAMPDCRAIALDGDYLYFADYPGEIQRVPKSGGAPTMVAADAKVEGGLVVTATSLYWLVFANRIMRMDKP